MIEAFAFVGSFIISFIGIYLYKKIDEKKRFATGIDVNKADRREIPEGAGIVLLLPIWIGIAYLNFSFGFSIDYIAWGLVATAFAIIGFFDDLKHKFLASAVPWLTRALPIALISLVFAYFYSPSILWIVPIALFVAGLASFQNTFAGLNGWEIGSSFVISLFVALVLVGTNSLMPALILSGAVFGLLVWNKYPAKVFPGDSGTLLIGSSIASIVVLAGKTEVLFITFLFFIPHIIDFFFLKLLTNPKDVTQRKMPPYKLQSDGRIAIPDYKDNKIRYDFAKLLLRFFGPMKEWKIVLIIWVILIINCSLLLSLFNVI